MNVAADLAQLVTALAALLVAWRTLRHARAADHALNGRPGAPTVSEDVASIEARGVRDDERRGPDPQPPTNQET